jgi:ribosomal protein L11 methyltransferase
VAQHRYYMQAYKPAAQQIFDVLERELEEDGWPLSIFEVDEKAGLFEISAYLDEPDSDVGERLNALLPDGADRFVDEILPDIDWVTKSLEGLKPVRAGRFLVHGSHDRDRRRIGDLPIEIEAGLAFGTGHHGTTAGCLQVLGEVVRREQPRNALDLGTGSAVLAIAVAKLARIPVLATDIDPVAVKVAAENARLNGVEAYVDCVTATGFGHPAFGRGKPFDLIIANILARPLMRLAPEMARHLTPGGSLILSGILKTQRNAVVAAYAGQKFRHVRTLQLGDWVTIHLKR